MKPMKMEMATSEKQPKESAITAASNGSRVTVPWTTLNTRAALMLLKLNSWIKYTIRLIDQPVAANVRRPVVAARKKRKYTDISPT